MSKIKYKDKVAAMFAVAMCQKAGKKGNPNRREKRVYQDSDGYWYITSKNNEYTNEQ